MTACEAETRARLRCGAGAGMLLGCGNVRWPNSATRGHGSITNDVVDMGFCPTINESNVRLSSEFSLSPEVALKDLHVLNRE